MDPNNNFMAGVPPMTPGMQPTPTNVPPVTPVEPVVQAPVVPAAPVMPTTPVAPTPVTTMQNPVVSNPVAMPTAAPMMANPMPTTPVMQNPVAPNPVVPNPAAAAANAAMLNVPQSNVAQPNTAQPNPMSPQAQVDEALLEAPAEPEKPSILNEEEIIKFEAAKPVPGSIGSAKSYTDIQREEAEKAARMAGKQGGKKLSTTTLILIILVAVLLIGGGIFVYFAFFNQPKPNPGNNGSNSYDNNRVVYSELSCKRDLVTEEYNLYKAVSGVQTNVFYFADDKLNGLETDFDYVHKTLEQANITKDTLAKQYGVTAVKKGYDMDLYNNSDDDELSEGKEGEGDSNSSAAAAEVTKKTVDQMLKHAVLYDDKTITHRMDVTAEDIDDWVASEAYSDVTYGAEQPKPGEEPVAVTRNLEYFQGLQNKIGYSCTISK